MAKQAVAAQAGGQDFQGRVFWHYAAGLRRTPPTVQKVCYEYDAAAGVDDVVVFYAKAQLDGHQRYDVDAIQAKYHVDQRDAYSLASLTENSGSGRSLLQKMYAGYREIRAQRKTCRAILESNWGWDNNDPVAKKVRADGRLPEQFLSDGPRSQLGSLRQQWKSHLGLCDEELAEFVRDLRLTLSLPPLNRQLRDLSAHLDAAGLEPLSPDKHSNPYDSIIRGLLQAPEPIEVDLAQLEEICRNEGLLREQKPPSIEGHIGIRSFKRWAQKMEVDCVDHVDLTEHFTGDRYIRNPEHWESVRQEVEAFLEQAVEANDANQIVLECHLTLAYLAGRCLPSISGASIIPVQKLPHGGPEPWRPVHPLSDDLPGWTVDEKANEDAPRDVVVALSVTHEILRDVNHYCDEAELSPRTLLHLVPGNGAGPSSVINASHAYALAIEATRLIREAKRHGDRVHVFVAAPNALMFFLGQTMTDLADPIQLYEHDRQQRHSTPYLPSLKFPQEQQ